MRIKHPFRMFFALLKRLLLKPTFVVTLLIVPVISVIFSLSVSTQDKGLLTCAVSGVDTNDPIYMSIVDKLLTEDAAMYFYEAGSPQEAREAIVKGKADCAWIFKSDLQTVIDEISKGDNTELYFADVIVAGDTMLQQLSREKLYSIIFNYISYPMYESFMTEQLDNPTEQDLQNIEKYYHDVKDDFSSQIVTFEFLDSPNESVEDVNYLLTPLKGLLGVCMLMSCLAAVIYSFQDKAEGRFSMYSRSNNLYIHLLCCLAASVLVGASVFASRLIIGDMTNIFGELLTLVVYMLNLTLFCTFAGLVLQSPKLICMITPVFIILTLVLCPIFIAIKGSTVAISYILPTFYYLKSGLDSSYIVPSLVYMVVLAALCLGTNLLRNKE